MEKLKLTNGLELPLNKVEADLKEYILNNFYQGCNDDDFEFDFAFKDYTKTGFLTIAYKGVERVFAFLPKYYGCDIFMHELNKKERKRISVCHELNFKGDRLELVGTKD